MPIVVEDGTGLVNANSYASVADADAYFTDRGNTAWGLATSDDKSSALINATDYIDTTNAGKWVGCVEFPDTPQALAFPRTKMVKFPDGVPAGVVRATYEYAVRWLSSRTLAPDPTIDESNRLYSMKLDQVGPIKEEVQFDDAKGSQYFTFRPWPYADALLKPYLRGNMGGVIRN
jgi:hypothetical protein